MSDSQERDADLDRIWSRLAEVIAEDSPAGLGSWDLAWDLVEPPSARFLQIASRYVAGEVSRESLIHAAKEVREAWKRAGDLFLRDAAPPLPSENGL